MTEGPLSGIKVVDLSQGAAGPVAAMLLGDLGADVVKVEPPGGEWGRGLGPPFLGGTAAAYLGMNRNKRGIVVDLKTDEGPEVVARLTDHADVFLESFRPGVAERLGIGFETLSARNPRLVYATISAFGRTGPWRDRPGVDGIVQAVGGIMSVTGTEDAGPVKVGVPAADMVAGVFSSQAVTAALFARERTGRGQRVDLSLIESLLAFQVVPLSMYLASGTPPRRMGSAAPYSAPNEAYPTADGWIQVAAYTATRWPSLCEALGRPELADDPRFATNADRVRNRDELRRELEAAFETKTTKEWLVELEAADVLCGPILGYPELLAEDHLAEIGALPPYDQPGVGTLRAVTEPARFSETPAGHRRPAPLVPGEHTEEILAETGFTPDEIEDLIRRGVVTANRKEAT